MADLKTRLRCLTSGHVWRDSHSQPGHLRCLRCHRLQARARKGGAPAERADG